MLLQQIHHEFVVSPKVLNDLCYQRLLINQVKQELSVSLFPRRIELCQLCIYLTFLVSDVFLLPLCCVVSLFFIVRYSVSWFKTMRSHILEAAGSNETGRLLFAISWLSSLSLIRGIVSANSHSFRNMDDCSKLLTISVKIGRIHGSASLITALETLSYPDAFSMERTLLPF